MNIQLLQQDMKKKIVWVTADYFVDSDLFVIGEVAKKYDMHWIIVSPMRKPRFKQKDFIDFRKMYPNVDIEFFRTRGRFRGLDPRCIWDNYRLASRMRNLKADFYYLNVSLVSLWSLSLWNRVKHLNIIVTAHQGAIHDGFQFKRISKLMHRLVYSTAKTVNMFSISQATLFKQQYPKPQVRVINLALKDFGIPTVKYADGSSQTVRFLSFGTINYGKHIDLLIDAACNLYESGIKNFKVSINGKCDNWTFYQSKMRYPEIFECDIRSIENSEIPNLFAATHYFVQPYRIVTQSGPLKIAFNYNRPVIVTNMPGFTDEVKEGINGFIFESNDVKGLESIMKHVILHHAEIYDNLVAKMNGYTRENYSNEAIGEKYISMFKELEQSN